MIEVLGEVVNVRLAKDLLRQRAIKALDVIVPGGHKQGLCLGALGKELGCHKEKCFILVGHIESVH